MDVPNFKFDEPVPDSAKRLIARKKGHPKSNISLLEYPIPSVCDLDKHEVLIELICAPINYADLLNMRGYYGTEIPQFPLSLGFEGLFRVLGHGKGVVSLDRGDLVMVNSYTVGKQCS
ncbi:hypothetical protein RF11_14871 [Thelohanellus kitauei]|uniref:Enoyl-[acyl-carrier-protein] reductase, mitochondrial n=1 Tax=Thelohanellus kitauei TaxID=669202 RepID=A0A0C2NG68_THEKT|nr:hypothetical protein RF11_14871 [Thelohanellus kitauei]